MRVNAKARGSLPEPRALAGEAGVAGTLDLKPLVRLLRWRARSIALFALAALIAAGALLFIIPTKYTATAVVLLDPREARVTTSESVISGIGSDAAAVESQVEVVQSPVLARRVIEEMKLATDPEFASPSLIETIAASLGFPQETSPERRMARLLDRFSRALRVSRRGLTYNLEVNFTAATPEKAAQLANALAQAYIAEQQALRRALTENASAWLDDRIEAMRERLRKSEQAVADFKTKHNVVDVLQGGKLNQRRMEDVSRELAVAQLRKAEVGGRLQQIEAARAQRVSTDALAELMQSQTIGALRARYADVAGLVARYSSMYGSKHPSLMAAKAQLGELQEQIELQIARVIAGLRDDYAAASKQQSALEAELAKLKEQAEEQEQVSVQLAALTREAEADRALFNQYLNRLKETNQEQTLRFDNARIISPALPPLKPNRPGVLILLLAAGLGGLMLGAGTAVFTENVRSGLRSAEDVQEALGVACLGIVPRPVRPPSMGARTAVGKLRAAATEHSRSVATIATRLRRSAECPGEVLIVTSALDGEGKSEFTRDLALAMAASGARTLLIDGDDHGCYVSETFALDQAPPQDLAEGRTNLTKMNGPGVIGELFVVGSTDGTQTAEAKRIGELVQDQRHAFDAIIIDIPPIVTSGGGQLLDIADRAVLVARWSTTDRAAVADAVAMIEPHDRKLAGIVLTEASPRWYRLFVQGKYAAAGRRRTRT